MQVSDDRVMAVQVCALWADTGGMKAESSIRTTRPASLARPPVAGGAQAVVPVGLQLEFHTDLICPWCYVFKRRLDQVLGSVHAPVQISWIWQPLFPDLPARGAPFSDWIRRHFREYSNPQQVFNQLQLAALREELSLNLLTLGHLPHPEPAWRLMLVAEEQGVQHDLGELIYRALFQENMDISRWEVLRSLALCLGMDRRSIDSARDDARIGRILQAQRAWSRQASPPPAPPVLTINRAWEIRGMVSRDVLLRHFDRALFDQDERDLPCC